MVDSHLPNSFRDGVWEENYHLCPGKEKTLTSHLLEVYLTAERDREKGPAHGIAETNLWKIAVIYGKTIMSFHLRASIFRHCHSISNPDCPPFLYLQPVLHSEKTADFLEDYFFSGDTQCRRMKIKENKKLLVRHQKWNSDQHLTAWLKDHSL